MNIRFEAVTERFNDHTANINKRFDDHTANMNKRFEEIADREKLSPTARYSVSLSAWRMLTDKSGV
jgi:hypothetical protein